MCEPTKKPRDVVGGGRVGERERERGVGGVGDGNEKRSGRRRMRSGRSGRRRRRMVLLTKNK